ncbi:DNA-binding LacI/PurR family transcriptional regulator [Microbacterium terrae]|uniref:Lactose operon repressor n=2 Tax=Microbacterium terrae TaxID=69369 RepID=A0A0M2HFL6_9MICO|nr:Lactose operon repressor [Microbacterium terrae]MBP1079361.1 DNA-binding LacI/PurR family transcriptional regulator [Microbacterium terrae]
MQRRVSMADVAALAGVSGQTVSRVVNDSPRVDPATRARVEVAMADLGYRPHRAARALRTGRTQTLGLVVSTLETVGNFRMLQAVTAAATARGFAVTIVTVGAAGELEDAFERLRDQGVDGAVVLNEATAIARGSTLPADLRLVVVDSAPDGRVSIVQSDHAAGARAATGHLLALGHATVHHLAGPDGSFAASERERGWREALIAAGAPVAEPVRGDWSSASGHVAASAFDADVTAVFAANDQSALGLLRGLAESGRDVPGDVSVVGFDDVADAADYRPPLTTVRQRFDVLGERAVATLVDGLDDARGQVDEAVPTQLVVRASTASPTR